MCDKKRIDDLEAWVRQMLEDGYWYPNTVEIVGAYALEKRAKELLGMPIEDD